MAFDLSFGAQVLMTSNSSTNRGTENGPQTGLKSAGNLPITSSASQVQNSQASNATGTPERIYFGLTSQSSTTSFDTSGGDNMVILGSFQFNAPNRIQITTRANEGASIAVVSGTTEANFKRWFIGGNDTPVGSAQAGPITFAIDCNADTPDTTGGTFNNAQLSGWGFGCVRFNLSGSSTTLLFFQRVWLFTTTKGSARIPSFNGAGADWDDAFIAVQGTDYTDKIGAWLGRSGNSFFVPCPFQFGDGSTATTFNDNGAVVVSPGDRATGQENFVLTDNSMRVYLNQRDNAADSVTLSGVYDWGTASPWDFDEDKAATCTITGATFNGMGNFTLGASVTGGANFNLASGAEVIVNGANINGSTITGDCRLQTATNLSNVTINGDLYVEIGANATIDFTGVTVTGNVFNDSGSNTLTINSLGGSSITAGDTGTGNGQTNVVATVQVAFTVNPAITGYEWRIYEVTAAGSLAGATELDGEETAVSSSQTYNHNSTGTITIAVQVISADYEEEIGYFTLASTDLNLTINLTEETND